MFIPAFSYFDIGTDMIYLNGSLVLGWDSDRKTAIPAHMNVFILHEWLSCHQQGNRVLLGRGLGQKCGACLVDFLVIWALI